MLDMKTENTKVRYFTVITKVYFGVLELSPYEYSIYMCRIR